MQESKGLLLAVGCLEYQYYFHRNGNPYYAPGKRGIPEHGIPRKYFLKVKTF